MRKNFNNNDIQANNVIFSNGSADPWTLLGMSKNTENDDGNGNIFAITGVLSS